MHYALRLMQQGEGGSDDEDSYVQSEVDVVCLGETMAQVLPSNAQSLEISQNFSIRPAGAESNVAHGLAQLGTSVAWVSRLGDDALGRRILAELEGSHINTASVTLDAQARTGLFLKDPNPVDSTVVYYRDGSAASRMSATDVARAFSFKPRIMHLTGITPALSKSCHDAVEFALNNSEEHGVAISFDVNYRSALWLDAQNAAETLRNLASRADVVFVGLDEAETLWGTPNADDVRSILGGVATLVVKDGSREAVEYSGSTVTRVPALPVNVIEPIGAGDAFAAGWLHGLLSGLSPEIRLRLGHLMAAQALMSITDHFRLSTDPSDLVARAHENWPDPAMRFEQQ